MNTLNLIRKQIEKAAALHDAQIANTAYRGVAYDTRCVESKESHGTFCYRGRTYTSDSMEALQVVGLTSLGCAAFLAMIYGELLLLHKV